MAKEVIIRLQVPEWVDVERIREDMQKIADEMVVTREQTANEARRFYGVHELREEVDVLQGLDAKLEELRRNRDWRC